MSEERDDGERLGKRVGGGPTLWSYQAIGYLCNTQSQFGLCCLFFRDCKAGGRQKCCCSLSLPLPTFHPLYPKGSQHVGCDPHEGSHIRYLHCKS